MAIVANKADGTTVAKDKSFATYNRTSAGSPAGTLTPQYAGEIVLDTTNNTLWRAEGTANTTWVAATPRV